MTQNDSIPFDSVVNFFKELQSKVVERLENLDTKGKFSDEQMRPPHGGFSRARVLSDGQVFEKAAAQFTLAHGQSLPPAATATRPEFTNCPFSAVAVSVIVHPRNPHVATTHMNLRLFLVQTETPTWYFGGGFDLTPYILYREDAILWHQHARSACRSDEKYQKFKDWCDRYFYLKHRKEARGIGGLFFDDLSEGGFDSCFDFVRLVGEHFLSAYTKIVQNRVDIPWNPEQEEWMLIRRGRYAEFNLTIDRGTKYGLQSGRRIESVLASLPPRAHWRYNHQPKPHSDEVTLLEVLTQRVDWLGLVEKSVENRKVS